MFPKKKKIGNLRQIIKKICIVCLFPMNTIGIMVFIII